MGILDFPTELLLLVAENLSIGDLSKLRSTSRQLLSVLTPRFEWLCLQDIGELTALQWAAVRGHTELIKLAISRGAEIDKPLRGKLVETALSMFDWHDCRSICALANNRARPGVKDSTFRTPLFLAACSWRLEAIKELLKLGASMQCFGDRGSPAHISAYRGNVDCMRAFIGARFDINTRGRRGRTVLHEAMYGGDRGVEMVEYLLQLEGGERLVNARDSGHRTPLHLAAGSYEFTDVIRVRMIELLLQHGADIHARDRFENTPAHLAAGVGDIYSMRVLIAAGVDFRARGRLGQTILHRAIKGRTGMLKYLLGQKGGRRIIHVRDNHGKTPLNYVRAICRCRRCSERLRTRIEE